MNYKLIKEGESLRIKDIRDFHPRHIFECGQAFNWRKEDDDSYTTIAFGKVLNVKLEDDDLILNPATEEEFYEIWYDYFDLGTDYALIKEHLRGLNETMAQAVDYGWGIRILNQEPFETIISFIISANNQIPRIKNSVRIIAQRYGENISNEDYSFPNAQRLSQAKAEDLREHARVGFRDERIVKSSEMIRDSQVDIPKVYEMNLDDARDELMKLPGVGPKVADCCLLFAFKKPQSFPVDVWIKRTMEALFLKREVPLKEVAKLGRETFGEYAGYAQQYIFYYGRENEIGK